MPENCTDALIRISEQTLARQARIIEILLEMQRTLNFVLSERRRALKSADPDGRFLVSN